MDTIYALVVIISGTLVPQDSSNPDLLSGEVVNKTTVYFRTLEACEIAYEQTLATKSELEVPEINSSIEVRPCEGIQVAE